MYIWLFISIIDYQLLIHNEQYIQQHIQLQAKAEYTAGYSAL